MRPQLNRDFFIHNHHMRPRGHGRFMILIMMDDGCKYQSKMVCGPFSSLVLPSPHRHHTRRAGASCGLRADGPVCQHASVATFAWVWKCLMDIHCHVTAERQENVVCILREKN